MAEYIEKSVLLEAFTNADHPIQYPDGSHGLGLGYADFRAILFDLPAADVVEVVRCKDCIYYKTPHCTMDIWHTDVTLYRAKENDFCSYGKRKDNG